MNSLKINLQNHTSFHQIPSEDNFTDWIQACFDYLQTAQEILCKQDTITLIIVTEDTIKKLNHQFRNKPATTNVLSFPEQLHPGEERCGLGDIVFCLKKIQDEAKEYNIPIDEHFAHLTIHGVLHLLGYDHITDHDANIMETLEINILDRLGIENPYE